MTTPMTKLQNYAKQVRLLATRTVHSLQQLDTAGRVKQRLTVLAQALALEKLAKLLDEGLDDDDDEPIKFNRDSPSSDDDDDEPIKFKNKKIEDDSSESDTDSSESDDDSSESDDDDKNVCCVGCGARVCGFFTGEEPPHKDSLGEAVCWDCWDASQPPASSSSDDDDDEPIEFPPKYQKVDPAPPAPEEDSGKWNENREFNYDDCNNKCWQCPACDAWPDWEEDCYNCKKVAPPAPKEQQWEDIPCDRCYKNITDGGENTRRNARRTFYYCDECFGEMVVATASAALPPAPKKKTKKHRKKLVIVD